VSFEELARRVTRRKEGKEEDKRDGGKRQDVGTLSIKTTYKIPESVQGVSVHSFGNVSVCLISWTAL
jgi:hypothetical protein